MNACLLAPRVVRKVCTGWVKPFCPCLAGFENLAEQTRLFIRLWCLKEAYVKATGRGILAPPGLRAFTFELLLNIKVQSLPLKEIFSVVDDNVTPRSNEVRFSSCLIHVGVFKQASLIVNATSDKAIVDHRVVVNPNATR